MRRLLRRIHLAGVLITLAVASALFNGWQRLDEGLVAVTVRNFTTEAMLVRLSDGTTGSSLGTFEVPDTSTAMLLEHQLDLWYRDLTIDEQAAGRTRAVVVELLGTDGCDLVSRQRVDHRDPQIDILDDGLATFVDAGSPKRTQGSVVADPCGGQPLIASAEVVNRTLDPILLGNGIVVLPCTDRTFRAGKVATSGALATQAAVPVRVPSIDAQDERWPMERRLIEIGPEGVFDDAYGPIGGLDASSCEGHVPSDAIVRP